MTRDRLRSAWLIRKRQPDLTMITNTLMIFGPGGIGKSSVDCLIRGDAARIDPYRLRPTGPRDADDVFYAHPKLRSELRSAFEVLGDSCEPLSSEPAVDWFARSRAAMFDVRGEWQCLLFSGLSATYAKAEIYAPAVPALLSRQDLRDALGALTIIILNPVSSLRTLGGNFSTLKSATAANCEKRGDKSESIEKRTKSIDVEAAAWRCMLDLGATEFPNWPFPEYIYRGNETRTRLAARARLITGNPGLEAFFKPESEIRGS